MGDFLRFTAIFSHEANVFVVNRARIIPNKEPMPCTIHNGRFVVSLLQEILKAIDFPNFQFQAHMTESRIWQSIRPVRTLQLGIVADPNDLSHKWAIHRQAQMPQNLRIYVVEGTDSTPFTLIALENLPAQDIGGGVDDGQW